jgi:hypothetical protein
MMELQKLLASYGERVGAPKSGSRRSQSEATMRAAAAAPVAPEPDLAAPVEHYDDLDADEIVGLVDSLEGGDLGSLLDYEQAHLARPRVVSAIEGVLARRRTGDRG